MLVFQECTYRLSSSKSDTNTHSHLGTHCTKCSQLRQEERVVRQQAAGHGRRVALKVGLCWIRYPHIRYHKQRSPGSCRFIYRHRTRWIISKCLCSSWWGFLPYDLVLSMYCLGFKLRFLPQSQKVAVSPGEDWNCRKRGFLDFEIRIRSRSMAIFREKMWLFSHLSFRFDSEQNLGTCFSSRLSCSFGCNLHGPIHFRKSCAGTITVLSLCKWGRERQSSSLHHSVNLNSQALKH